VEFLVAIVVAVVVTPLAAIVATRMGIVDRPGPLKVHTRAVPYLGGVAVFLAVTAALASSRPRLLVPIGLAVAVGVLDDFRPQPVTTRIVGQVVVGAAAGWAAPFPIPLGGVLTAVAVIGLLNAVNLIDGLDGLAAGTALMSAVGFAVLGGSARTPALALAGALVGFLVYNRPPARVYLGDGGAYVIGTALALMAALAVDSDGDVATWAAIPLLVAVPVLDTLVSFVRRLRAHRPLFLGDRAHVYDQLVDRGRSPEVAVLCLVALQAVLVLVALGVANLETAWAVTATVGTTVVLAGLVGIGGFVGTSDPSGAA
jgi:UDP-GlcNAc:undecaprenyl-phosphate GlcNAc-1-phosphate transferase